MNHRHRNLLAIALATALISPAAWAEKGGKGADPAVNEATNTAGAEVSEAVRSVGQTETTDRGQAVSEAAREANASTQVSTSNDASVDATTSDTTTSNNAGEAATQTPPPRGAHERMVKNPTNTEEVDLEKAPPTPPTQSQGADHATAHASVTQRELFGRLDTDGDGQISAAESAVDAEFNTGFQAMDSNDDGLVTDAEYQVAARTDLGSGQAQGGTNAASHSTAAVRDLVGRLDTNADGSISATEAQADAGFNASFATADANSDGLVTSEEYRAWTQAQRK